MIAMRLMMVLLSWSLSIACMQDQGSAENVMVPPERLTSFYGSATGTPARQARRPSVSIGGAEDERRGSTVFNLGNYRLMVPNNTLSGVELAKQLKALPESSIYEVNLAHYVGERSLTLETMQVVSFMFRGNTHLTHLAMLPRNLKGLDVSNCENLMKLALRGEVKKLTLSGCICLVDLDVCAEGLEIIDVQGCDSLTDGVLRKVFRYHPLLRVVSLNRHSTLQTVVALLLHAHYVTRLDVSASSVDSADIMSLVQDYATQYKHEVHLTTRDTEHTLTPQISEGDPS